MSVEPRACTQFTDEARLIRPGIGRHVDGRYAGAQGAVGASIFVRVASLEAGVYTITVDGSDYSVTFSETPRTDQQVSSALASVVEGVQAVDIGGGKLDLKSDVDTTSIELSTNLEIMGVAFDITASIQPMRPDEFENLSTGRMEASGLKFYTEHDVQSLDEYGPEKSDLLEFDGEMYEVHKSWRYKMGQLDHTKSLSLLLEHRDTTRHDMSFSDDFEDDSWLLTPESFSFTDDFEDVSWEFELSATDDFEDASWEPTLSATDDFEDSSWLPQLSTTAMNDDFESPNWSP